MILKYMKVSLFEISYKKKNELFHNIQFLLNVPVYCLLALLFVWVLN